MYFKDRDNTNIDDEFDKGENKLLNFIKDKKIIFGIFFLFLILIVGLVLFFNKKESVDSYNLILIGDDVITIYQDDDYIEPGYKAYNSKGDDVTKDVKISSNVNVNVIGEYEINYKINDVIRIRKIIVIKKPDVYTYIRLNAVNNDINIYLKIGDKYIEPGYKVYSSTGEDYSNKVTISGVVDTSKKGNYQLIYTFINSDGTTISVSRMVIVMDTDIKLSLNTKEYTNNDVIIEVSVFDEYFDYMILPDNTKIEENSYSYKVYENGEYNFKTYNSKGLVKEESIKVSNIDKVSPTGSCNGSYKNGVSTINVSASDNVGIKQYVIDGVTYTENKISINKEMKLVNVVIFDKANNIKSISCNLEDKNVKVNLDGISSGYPSKKLDGFPNISVNYYNDFTYWVYYPAKFVENLPVVVFIGGLGHVGNDYESGKKTAIRGGPIDQVIKNGVQYNAIVVTLQVPYKNSDDTVYKYTHKYVSLLNKLVDKLNADKNKISIMGYSHGCFGVMTIVNQYPKYFSAVVPVGCTWNQKNISSKNFINQPIWAISSTFDGNYEGHVSLKTFVNTVNDRGGNAKYTYIKKHHDDLFRDSYSVVSDSSLDIINWMISQKK